MHTAQAHPYPMGRPLQKAGFSIKQPPAWSAVFHPASLVMLSQLSLHLSKITLDVWIREEELSSLSTVGQLVFTEGIFAATHATKD